MVEPMEIDDGLAQPELPRQLSDGSDWGEPKKAKTGKGKGDEWGDGGDAEGWDDEPAAPKAEEEGWAAEEASAPIASSKAQYRLLDQKMLQKKREALINEAKEELYLQTEETDLILRYLRYNTKKIVEQFLSDSKAQVQIRQEAGVCAKKEEVKGKKEEPKGKKAAKAPDKATCGACSEPVAFADAAALNCGHWVCNECWTGFLVSEINAGINSVFSRCPALDSKGKRCREVIPLPMFKKHLTAEQFDKINAWVIDHFVDCNKALRYCPGKGCRLAVEYGGGGQMDVHCRCGVSFCFSCGGAAHAPCPCDLSAKWLKVINNDEASSQRLIESLTKPCPKCNTRIEKNRHCNHMKCSKCNFDFCWQCMEEIRIDGVKHPSWYVCKNREKAAEEGKLSKEENERLKLNELLGKLGFHQGKIDECQKGGKTAKSLVVKTSEKEGKLAEGRTLNWLVDVIKHVVEAERFLEWSYVFCYFLQDSARKTTFLNWQKVLEEKTKGVLSDLEKAFGDEKSFEQFLNDKVRISGIKKFGELVATKTKQMQGVADEISEALMNEADSKTSTWSCIRCSARHDNEKEGKKIIICEKCRACRTHGDFDCLVLGCKQS